MRSACPAGPTPRSTAPRSQRVLAAAQEAGVTAGVLAASREAAEEYVADGFGFVGIGSDSTFVATAARAAAAQLITAN